MAEEIIKHHVAEEPMDPISRLLGAQTTNGIVVNIRCKLCNSAFRTVVEEMFDVGTPLVDIKKYLEDKGEFIALSNISHHLKQHYRNQVQLAQLIEITENAKVLVLHRRERADDIRFSVALLWGELARVLSLQTNGDMKRERDRNEMIIKTNKCIYEATALLGDMDHADARVRDVQQKFIKVWNDKIQTADNDEQRDFYITTLQHFQSLIGKSEGQ